MNRFRPIALSLVAIAAAGTAAAAEPDVEDFLPANAPLALCYYGDNPDLEGTALAQLVREPEVQEWLTSVRQAVLGLNQFAAGFLGVNALSLKPLLGCRVGLALMPGQGGPPQALVVAKVGAEGEVREAVDLFFQRLAPGRGAPGAEVGGIQLTPLGPMRGPGFGFRGDFFFLATSPQALEAALAAEAPKLRTLPAVRQAARMNGTPVALLAYDHAAMTEALGPMMPEALRGIIEGMGLGKEGSLVLRLGADGRALVGGAVVRTGGERTGLLKAFGTEPVDRALLKLAPRDADLAWAGNIQMVAAYEAALDIVHAFGTGLGEDVDVRGAVAAFEAQAGVDLRADLFGSLGQGTVITTSGKSIVPALILSQAVKDAERFEQALEKIVAHLDRHVKAEVGPEAGAALKTIRFRGHTIRYLATPGVPVPVAPCMARVGDRVVMGFSPIHLKDYLLFLDGNEPSILDRAEVREQLARVPEGAVSVGYSNVGEAFVDFYGFLGPLLSFAHGIPHNPVAMDFANLPSKRTLRKHLFGSISHTAVTRDTFAYECRSPFGVPFLGPAPAGAPALAMGGVLAGMLLPALARARTEARLIRDRNNLNQIGKGLFTYLNEFGDNRFFPRSLGELWDKKVIPDKGVFVSPLDRDPPKLPNGLPCSYESCFDRHPNRVFRDDFPPNIICAWDRVPFVEGRRNVMFFDSHVEAMDEARFQEELRRLDELAEKLEERKHKRGEF